jgi:hypothetical protein
MLLDDLPVVVALPVVAQQRFHLRNRHFGKPDKLGRALLILSLEYPEHVTPHP